MPKYFLDTGIILGYIRAAEYAKYIEQKFKLMAPSNISLISIVTVGEIYSLAEQFRWGPKRKSLLENILSEFDSVDISYPQILRKYAEIDAFSQGKYATKKLPEGTSARNMGKNDLWIAATASVLKAILLTTDKDFGHLDGEFLKVIYIDTKANY